MKLACLLRKYDWFPRKLIICFGNIIFKFENMNFPKKVNYLLRKYDFFVRECDKSIICFGNMTLLIETTKSGRNTGAWHILK